MSFSTWIRHGNWRIASDFCRTDISVSSSPASTCFRRSAYALCCRQEPRNCIRGQQQSARKSLLRGFLNSNTCTTLHQPSDTMSTRNNEISPSSVSTVWSLTSNRMHLPKLLSTAPNTQCPSFNRPLHSYERIYFHQFKPQLADSLRQTRQVRWGCDGSSLHIHHGKIWTSH